MTACFQYSEDFTDAMRRSLPASRDVALVVHYVDDYVAALVPLPDELAPIAHRIVQLQLLNQIRLAGDSSAPLPQGLGVTMKQLSRRCRSAALLDALRRPLVLCRRLR